MTMLEQIQGLKLKDVEHVYRGERDACCCGCSGVHTYPVGSGESEEDDQEVADVLAAIKGAFLGEITSGPGEGLVSANMGAETLIVYLKEGVEL